jgi:hypothetical protein
VIRVPFRFNGLILLEHHPLQEGSEPWVVAEIIINRSDFGKKQQPELHAPGMHEPMQFWLHNWNQSLERAFVPATPIG